MKLKIVKGGGSDADVIADILTDATAYKINHRDTAWGTGAFTKEEVLEQMAQGSAYVVYLANEPVATVTLQDKDERVWGPQPFNASYLHRLAVKDGWHGQDLGAQIIDWALLEAANNNHQFLRLDCDPQNTKLCAYYEKQGFRQVGSKHFPDHNYTAALYERPVS